MEGKDDWRLTTQERYLRSATLRLKRYYRWSEEWSHDHCEFCWTTFVPPGDPYPTPHDLHEGYAVLSDGDFPDDYHWVCAKCFANFKDMFEWKVVR